MLILVHFLAGGNFRSESRSNRKWIERTSCRRSADWEFKR